MLQVEKPDEIKPEFVITIPDVVVHEGLPAQFVCKVKAVPEATIMWYHDGLPIKHGEVYQMIPGKDGQHTLDLPEVFLEDGGTYTVKAVNPFGEAECSAKLVVEGLSWLGLMSLLYTLETAMTLASVMFRMKRFSLKLRGSFLMSQLFVESYFG